MMDNYGISSIEMKDHKGQYLLSFFTNFQMPGRQYYLKQRHAELEILLVTQGRGQFLINNHIEYTCGPGDVFILGANEDHYTPVIFDGDNMRTIGVRFRPQLIWAPGNNLFDMKYLKVFFNRSENFRHMLDAKTPATGRIGEILYQIQQEFKHSLPDFELEVKVLLLSILVELNRSVEHINEDFLLALRGKQSAQLEKSMLFIDANIDSEITLDGLAAQANMSRSYFCQMFKALNGISAWNYIINKRIELAQNLLSHSDDNILEVAYKCGFNNSTNFNRAFKKVTGAVPSEFRKFWQQRR